MLKIILENTTIPLKDASFTLRFNNPMFEDSGSYSLPFNIPGNSNIVRRLLDFPHKIENAETFTKNYDCKLLYDGQLFINGLFKISKTSENNYRGTILPGTGDFFSRIKDVKLTDLELGGDRTYGSLPADTLAYFNDTVNYGYPDRDYVLFPVYNEIFYDGYSGTFDWGYVQNEKFHMNYWNKAGGFEHSIGPGGPLIPFPYLCYVIDRMLNENGFATDNNMFYSDSELRTLTVFNTYAAMKQYGSDDPDFFNWPLADTTVNLSNHVPDTLISDYIKGLQNKFCCTFFADNRLKRVSIKKNEDIITSPVYENITDKCEPYTEITHDDTYDGFKLSESYDGNDEYISEKLKEITDAMTVKASVYSQSNLPASGNEHNDIRLVEYENAYYKWSDEPVAYPQTEAAGWEYYSPAYLPYKSEGEEYSVSTSISTLLEHKGLDAHSPENIGEYRYWLVPRAEMPGNSPALVDWLNNPFSPRLLFYRGLQSNGPNTGGYTNYPLGSSYVYNWWHVQKGNYSLTWDGDYGLYEKFWKKYLYWIMSRRKLVKKIINFSATDLADIDMSKIYMIDGTKYLIKNIQVNVSSRGIGKSTVYLYKI